MTAKQKQCLLAYLGYYAGSIDGIWGPQSRKAALSFQKDCGLKEDAQFGRESRMKIREIISLEEEVHETDLLQDGFWREIRHFTRQEFACRCGKCGGFPTEPDQTMVRLAEEIREHFDAALIPSSGVRCESHNAAVGGVPGSRHLLGKAVDFCVQGKTAEQVMAYAAKLPGVRYIYAIDSRYVHLDVA